MHGAALWGLTDVVRFLHKSGAKLDVEDKRRFTPLEAALGMAGGFGFDSKSSVVREDTAKAIRELMGVAPDYVPPARPHPPAARALAATRPRTTSRGLPDFAPGGFKDPPQRH